MKLEAKEIISRLKDTMNEKGGLKAVYFIGCGGSNAALYSAYYLMANESGIPAYSYTSDEFLHMVPKALDERCLCILCSMRATKETVSALKLCNEKGAFTVALTGSDDTLMAQTARYYLTYTVRSKGNQATALKLVFELLKEYEAYPYYEQAMAAYDQLDSIVEQGLDYIMPYAQKFAMDYKNEDIFYILASGTLYASAYTMACCHLMEMQWKHAVALHSAEYFHGPFETTDKELPVILLKGVGKTRPIDERAEKFIKQYTNKYIVVDTKEFGIDAIDENVAQYFNAVVMITIERELVYQMSLVTGHDMDMRRYMWQFEY